MRVCGRCETLARVALPRKVASIQDTIGCGMHRLHTCGVVMGRAIRKVVLERDRQIRLEEDAA